MTTREAVEQAENQKEALLVIADTLDYIAALLEPIPPADDGWAGTWDGALTPDGEFPQAVVTTTEDEDGNVEVNIAPVSEQKKQRRFDFANVVLELEDHADDLQLGKAEVVGAYVHGGPVWLWQYNRDFVMTYSEVARRAMVDDVMEDDPKMAVEMGMDLLKQYDNQGDAQVRFEESING